MAQRFKMEQNRLQETISNRTLQTADVTNTIGNTRLQLSQIPPDRDTDGSISPISHIGEQRPSWLTENRNDVRQSQTFRHNPAVDKELEKMVYYDINNRLKDQPRKLTPQKVRQDKQFRTIQNEELESDMNTSRFGKNEKMMRKQYRKQRAKNLEAIAKNEKDYE